MSTPILLVATATRWYGAARMPRALAKAGFEVTLLTPKNSLAEKSRFVSKLSHPPDNATPAQWVATFAAAVRATTPRIVLPCDDMAFRLLALLAKSSPPGMQPESQLQLASLIRDSLGEPAHYRESIDKTRLPRAAATAGVLMPPSIVTTEFDEAERFAATRGGQVVLKRGHSSGGDGVEILARHDDLARAFAALQKPDVLNLEDSDSGRVLVQARVTGTVKAYTFLAWGGKVLTGYAGERMAIGPDEKGPITVNRYHHDAQLREAVAKLVQGLGMTGLAAFEFIVDDASGDPYLLEINRRLSGGTHRGSDFDVDHAAALLAAVHGRPVPTRATLDPDEEHLSVHFPQEWLRDPHSSWLRDYPVDVPWDDPGLLKTLVALRPAT